MLTLHPATESDIRTLTTIYLSAFAADPLSLSLFPAPSRTTHLPAWWSATNAADMARQPSARFLKVEWRPDAGDAATTTIAYAKWNVPATTAAGAVLNGGDDADALPAWPAGADERLCERFFGELARARARALGGQPHYREYHAHSIHPFPPPLTAPDLEILATAPSHRGLGAARLLIEWGLARADAARLPAYVEAGDGVVGLYERFGWRVWEGAGGFPLGAREGGIRWTGVGGSGVEYAMVRAAGGMVAWADGSADAGPLGWV